ncbi:MAG TPA: hypothetical protein VFR50_08320, partial [Casimicrobiaceae bacterium]|nr:hypothetical protein [Casimicrobiaceae bacterium]
MLSPAHAIAGGLGDPILNTTILAWDADRIAHGFRAFWDAPFLYPHRYTLAYSEHLLGVAWFTSPLIWLTRSAVFAYNVAYVGSYALAGFGMFLLVRSFVGRTDAAILAGLVFELTPYRLAQSTHLQVLLNGWMPIGLWALHNYFQTGRRSWAAAFTASYALLGLSNGYYFYFFALPVIVVVAFELAQAPTRRRRALAELAVAVMALASVALPVALVYYHLQQQGFTRTDEELGGLSARLPDYLHVPQGGWDWRGLLPVGGGERELFHGFVALTFAGLGVLMVRTRAVAMYAVIAAAAVWLSMGPNGGPVYGWLFQHVPGFNGLRVPARFASVAIVGISMLAGAGFAWVLAQLPRAWGWGWTFAMAAIILLEGQHGANLSRVPLADAKSWNRVAYDWLRTGPAGAALELNITEQDDFHPFTTMYQLEAVRHRHPIVNGYSGWKSLLQEWLGGPESPLKSRAQLADALRGLRAIGVRYVLLHDETFATPADAARMAGDIREARDQIAEEHRFGSTWAWRLADAGAAHRNADGRVEASGRSAPDLEGPRLQPDHADASLQRSRAEFLIDGDLDTRWLSGSPQAGDEWIELYLGEPADVARVEIVTAARSLYDYPRHIAVESDGR